VIGDRWNDTDLTDLTDPTDRIMTGQRGGCDRPDDRKAASPAWPLITDH
jgi:hypothetical protein